MIKMEAIVATIPAEKAKKIETEAPAVTPAAPVVAAVAAPTPEVKPAPVVAKPVAAAPAVKASKTVKTATKSVKTVAAKKPVTAKKVATPKAKVAPVKAAATVKGKSMTDTVKTVSADVAEKASELLKDVTSRAKTAFEKGGEITKEVVAFNKDNLEAVVESGKIAARGVQTAAQTAADFGRKNFEATTTMLKGAAAVKTPTELLKLQSDFAKSQFEAAVAEMSKSSEFTLKLLGDVFQPISNRYSVAAEMVKSRLAA